MDGTVLLADDDRTIRTVLTQALTRAGCRVHATGSLAQLLRWVEEGRGDAVITDVMMPDGNGLDLLPALHAARPGLPVIVISAQNTIVTAIRASAAEAFDYLPKPFDLPDLLVRLRAALARRPAAPAPAVPAEAEAGEPPLIGRAPAMQELFRLLARILNADLPVLLAGEAGSGKTSVARVLHQLSDRRAAPLVVVGPAEAEAGPAALAAQAEGAGVVLLEDPAGLPPAAQARLAALAEAWTGPGAGGPRVIATTGPDPLVDVAAGRMRADLYHRLAGITVAVPPLRARLDDLDELARHFLARAGAEGQPPRTLGPAALAALRAHPFPGNLRELEHLLRRLSLTGAGTEITAAEVAQSLEGAAGLTPGAAGSLGAAVNAHLQRYFALHGDQLPPPGLYDRILREVERPLLQRALAATGGNQLRAADLLGINRNTLRAKLTALNIGVTRGRRMV